MWSELRALALFELRRAVARPGTRMGVLLFVLILAAGHWEEWRGSEVGEGLFGAAHAVGSIGLLCFGLASDRRLHFDDYLLTNHIRAWVYLSAKALAIVALVCLYGVLALIVETVFSRGDIAGAAWLAVTLTLVALLVAPLAMLVEAFADTSMPAAFVLLAYCVGAAALYLGSGSGWLFDAPGLSALAPDDWGSLGRLGLIALAGVAPALVLAGAIARLRLRRY